MDGGSAEITYEVDFVNAAHHEAQIRVVFSDLGTTPLDLRMSRSSPGRYALHEFVKNAYDLEITDGAGRELAVERPSLHQWLIPEHDGTVVVGYTLFGDRADGTYSGIDRTQAHLNMPATFLWAAGLEDRPIRVSFQPPPGADWQVATQLAPSDDSLEFIAPNLAYFLDSPTHLSQLSFRSWVVDGSGGGQTIRVAVHHDGAEADVDRFVDAVKRIVDEEIAIWGEAPEFDYGTYTFISTYLPWVFGDGMEHRNSTILTSTASIRGDHLRILGTVAHEFFHAWNVERIRPASLEPFDFNRANVSSELWLAEGFTSYFDDVALRRAGIIDDAEFALRLGNAINTVVNAPGRRLRSPMEMSRRAPFVDAAVSIDPQNVANTFISYYTWGSVIGAGLDLALRQRSPPTTADDFMRELWRRHGATEQPYEMRDIESALAAVSGDASFASGFLDRFVRGTEVPDFVPLLAAAGMTIRPSRPGSATFGTVDSSNDGSAIILNSATLLGEPLYLAGLDAGDRILSLGGVIASETSLAAMAELLQPGDSVSIRWESRGNVFDSSVIAQEDVNLEVVLFEAIGRPVTDAINEFRAAWLGSRSRG